MLRLPLFVVTLSLLVNVPNLSASVCSNTTDCTLTLDQGNSSSGFGSANFGTVHLTLNTSTHVATIDVSLASGFLIGGSSGFTGDFGFVDSLGGGLTISNFSSALYSGGVSHATDDLHFDGFGFTNDAAATTHPVGATNGISEVSFTVSKGSSLTDVNQLLNLFSPAGGDGPAVFVVDVGNNNTGSPGAGNTGLVRALNANNPVPEPTSYLVLLGIAFAAIVLLVERRHKGRLTAE